MKITTIGLDIAKNVFQVHGIDAAEKVVVRKQLRRSLIRARKQFEAFDGVAHDLIASSSARMSERRRNSPPG